MFFCFEQTCIMSLRKTIFFTWSTYSCHSGSEISVHKKGSKKGKITNTVLAVFQVSKFEKKIFFSKNS